MSKLNTIYQEYTQTRVLTGLKVLYFVSYWLTKSFSFLQQRSSVLNELIHYVVRILPKPTFVIQNKSGIFHVRAFDDSTTICSDYFEKQLRGWLTTPDVKDIFVDIGANRGIYTIIAPTLFGYQIVHAFEPNPHVVTLLEQNVQLNQLKEKVAVHNSALGETAGTLPFTCDPMHLGGGRIVTASTEETVSVPVTVFDQLTPPIPPERISFIKIDTEGFEQSVLKGMQRTLTLMKVGSCIMIESTDLPTIDEVLGRHGFRLEKSSQHDHLFKKYA